MSNVVAINGKLFITTACQEPEVAMQYVNYCYTEPGKDLVAFGVKDLTYTKDADGKIAYTDLMTKNPDGICQRLLHLCPVAAHRPAAAVPGSPALP